MLSIQINVTGLDKAQERLTQLGASLHDFTSALTTLGKQLIIFYSQSVFISEGSALGKRWTPLAASTQAEKDRDWRGRGMLVRTGAMQQGFYSNVTPDTLLVSNSVPYFPYHQLGTSEGRGRGHNIPARQMIGVNSTVEAMIKSVMEADIRAKIAGTSV